MSVHVSNEIIKSEWTDYNNHLNMAYYVLIFDVAWEVILKKFNMGEHSAKTSGMSTMVVETRTTYDSEVKEGDEVEILLTFFDHDKKRIHFKLEMIEKKTKKLSSTIEMLSLFVDLNKRKVSEFDEERINLMDNFIKENTGKFKKDNLQILNKFELIIRFSFIISNLFEALPPIPKTLFAVWITWVGLFFLKNKSKFLRLVISTFLEEK